jgi:hypothetical protein
MVFYAEPIELPVFVGAAVIFGANYFNVRSERRTASASAKIQDQE